MRIQNQFGNRVQLELVQGGGGGVGCCSNTLLHVNRTIKLSVLFSIL